MACVARSTQDAGIAGKWAVMGATAAPNRSIRVVRSPVAACPIVGCCLCEMHTQVRCRFSKLRGAAGQVLIRHLKRRYVLFLSEAPCLVGIETWASSYYWSRELGNRQASRRRRSAHRV